MLRKEGNLELILMRKKEKEDRPQVKRHMLGKLKCNNTSHRRRREEGQMTSTKTRLLASKEAEGIEEIEARTLQVINLTQG